MKERQRCGNGNNGGREGSYLELQTSKLDNLDRTFHRLIRSTKISEVPNSSNNSSAFASDSTILKSHNVDFDYDLANFDSNLGVCISKFSLDNMANNYRTFKELATIDIMCQPWCIQYSELEQAQSYELKSGLIHLLPKFYGFVGEYPYKHLKEFHGERNLISNMASNIQQSGVIGFATSKVLNEVVSTRNRRLENTITQLTFLVRQLAIGQHHISPLVRVRGICAYVEHPIDVCPIFAEVATMMGDQQYRQLHDQYLNWRYGSHPTQHIPTTTSIQTITTYAACTIEFLGGFGQISQLATIVNQLQSRGSKQIPFQTVLSPQATMSVITLRNIAGANVARVVEVIEVQPPLPSIMHPSIIQPLQPLVITANKLQAKQKERLLQDLKKLRDFYEHLVKHSTLSIITSQERKKEENEI
ncbi:hypothetical protein CR513_22343, partial [Mucuna pruriens]